MRGGLDDALDKLARRDELRRRAEGGGIGTPPAVQDLVEAIVAVVGRNPALAVTVGVEGAGDPVLLHFAVENGIVQVSADNTVASRVAEAAPTSPRHADFDIDPEEPDPFPSAESGQATRPFSYDGPYRSAAAAYADDPVASHRRPQSWEQNHVRGPSSQPFDGSASQPFDGSASQPFDGSASPPFDGSASLFDAAAMRSRPFAGGPASSMSAEATRRIHAEHRRVPEEPPAADRVAGPQLAEQRMMPTPLPEPVPLKVDTAQTEMAAKRLAALLRDNPTLLRRTPSD